MKKFAGFPARLRYTPVPSPFFHAILPYITDMAEMRATLLLFWRLSCRKGYPKFVTLREMAANHHLLFAKGQERDAESLRRGLALATERGTIAHLVAKGANRTEDLYFLNREEAKRSMAQLLKEGFQCEPAAEDEVSTTGERPSIMALYEDNIGVLTPLVAEMLTEAEKAYPHQWIEDAFREAVSANKRNWRYVSKILERWSKEGRDGGAERDSRVYFEGPFGRLIKR